MRTSARTRYAGYRFLAEIIGHGVWLYFGFPLGLHMVEELLVARGVIVSHETVRQWAHKFSQQFANQIRRRLPRVGDKWHLDEVVLKIAGVKHWLWRAVDQAGVVLDVLVQRRRNKQARRIRPRAHEFEVRSTPRWRKVDSNLYGASPVKSCFWFVAGSLFGAGKPFFVLSRAIRFAEPGKASRDRTLAARRQRGLCGSALTPEQAER
jgi:putative transposase